VVDDNGNTVMIAVTILSFQIKSIKMDVLRPFCQLFGIKPRGKSKIALARELAHTKQMDSVIELAGSAEKQSSRQRVAMKIRLLNACFTDEHYPSFVDVNKKKSKEVIDAGMAGNSKDFHTCVSDMANDKANNDIVGMSNFPDNEHLLAAMTEGLDLNLFVLATWMQAKKLLSEAFKEHELAKERHTKCGSHEKDFFGDGFTKDLAACYFHLLLQQKPDAYKSVSTLLDDGVLYVAGAPAGGGHLKRLPAALEKKEKKAARQAQLQAEANIAGANAVLEPILATYLRTQSEREDRRLEEQQTRDALNQTRDAYYNG
jgi:hypothetical protein